MMRIIAIFMLAMLIPGMLKGQEYSFSHYYLDMLSVSPGYVSMGKSCEAAVALRSQWTGIDGGYRIYMAGYQHKMPAYNSGLGIRISGNSSGGGAFSTTCATATYGYNFHLSYKVKCAIGIEAGYINRSLHQGGLVYYSGIDPATGSIHGGEGAIASQEASHSITFGTGAVFYTKATTISLGLARISNTVISGPSNNYPTVISVSAGHIISLGGYGALPQIMLKPEVMASHSRYSDIIMPGVYLQARKLLLSLAYRCELQPYRYGAVVTTVGISLGRMDLTIGHDFETSAHIKSAQGSTEAGIRYKFENDEKNSGSKTIMCPAF